MMNDVRKLKRMKFWVDDFIFYVDSRVYPRVIDSKSLSLRFLNFDLTDIRRHRALFKEPAVHLLLHQTASNSIESAKMKTQT